MWDKVKCIKRFEEKSVIEKLIGITPKRIEGSDLFYYGNGFIIEFVSRKFYIDDYDNTVEYGEEGLYLISVYHFSNVTFLKKYMHLSNFEASDIAPFGEDIIDGYINYQTHFSDVRKAYRKSGDNAYYREGEKRTMSESEFVFLNQFVQWEPFTFLFEEDTKKALLSGFVYTPFE